MGCIHRAGAVAAASLCLLACPGINKQERDIDRTPIVDTGAGASIIYPGHRPPVYQGAQHPKQTGAGSYGVPGRTPPGASAGTTRAPTAPGGPETTAVRRSGSPPAPGGHITLIGGNTTEETRHIEIDEEPSWFKYVALPFAVVAAPFKYAADKLAPEHEPGPEVPSLEKPPPPAPAGPPPVDYETARLRELERELARRQGAAGGAPAPAPSAPPAVGTGVPSLAEELAMLRRAGSEPAPAPRPSRTAPAPEPAPVRNAPPPPEPDVRAARTAAEPERDPLLATASGHVDRDGDGRTDHWIFREGGEIEREMLDENFDGRPDRTLHYDLASHQVAALEEDADFDGRTDTWTALRGGQIVRRRVDADSDGHVDTWSFFRDGVLTRLERDSSGDGFRDRVSHYREGRLVREEQDADADGRAEAVRHYGADERVIRLEEDTDGDGRIDVVSHYEDGRLTRRELLDASALAPAPDGTEHN